MEVGKVPFLPSGLIPDSQLEGWATSGRWFIGFGCFLSGSWRGLMRRGGARRERPWQARKVRERLGQALL